MQAILIIGIQCRLRAAVLGANDGLVSVASIMLGVGAASQDQHTLILSGLSALVAGSLLNMSASHIHLQQSLLLLFGSLVQTWLHVDMAAGEAWCRGDEHGSWGVHQCGQPEGH